MESHYDKILYNTIESFNNYISLIRNNANISNKSYILHNLIIKQNSTFKIYKEYCLELWFINKKEKYLLKSFNQTFKVGSKDSTNFIYELLNNEILLYLFSLVNTEIFNNIVEGTYK